MRFSPRAGDATIFKKIASPSQGKNRSCSRGLNKALALGRESRQLRRLILELLDRFHCKLTCNCKMMTT